MIFTMYILLATSVALVMAERWDIHVKLTINVSSVESISDTELSVRTM